MRNRIIGRALEGLALAAFIVGLGGLVFVRGQGGTANQNNYLGGGAAAVAGVSGPPTTGLMGRYDIPATDTAAALTDSSGNGRNGTGTIGTPCTIVAVTGGLLCNGVGASTLPASLNTAKSIGIYMNASATSGFPTAFNGPVCGNGNLTTANAICVFLTKSGLANTSTGDIVWTWNNGSTGLVTYEGFFGTNSLIMTMDVTQDHLYFNGKEGVYYSTGTASAGKQTAGFYQIGGTAPGSGLGAGSYFFGTIYNVYFYDHMLSTLEVAQLNQWFLNQGAARGVPQSLVPNTSGPQILVQGDSISAGNGLTTAWDAAKLNESFNVVNRGRVATAIQFTLNNPSFTRDITYLPSGKDNVMVLWLGTNDCANGRTGTQIIQDLSSHGHAAQVYGWKVLVVDMISRASQDACKDSLDPLIASNWPLFANGYVSMSTDANLGADAANASATYFSDTIHPTQGGIYDDETPIMQRAVNRLTGNLSWSTATTYTTAAAAATAITATSEATNTVTVTSTLNPPVGSCVIITGVTPAGYNSPTSGGCWFVLTTSASSFTYWNTTSGLGAGTVFGVASVPQQKDADVYTILGGSATTPAFTLQSCEGYGGQNLYFMITNTTSNWVLTPFKSTETINGGATMNTPTASATNHPIVRLTSIPNAIATGGCTWQASLQ